MNRFSKDIDTIDNLLGDAMRMFTSTLSNIVGAIILIAIVLPWFLIAVFAILTVYFWAALFYRMSARELKRLGTVSNLLSGCRGVLILTRQTPSCVRLFTVTSPSLFLDWPPSARMENPIVSSRKIKSEWTLRIGMVCDTIFQQ